MAGLDCSRAYTGAEALSSANRRVNFYFALCNSTLAVANGMIASRSTGVRATLFAMYIVKCASFISSPFSNTLNFDL